MHLLIITANYKPYVGGAEKQAERMARVLVNRGWRVTVLTRRLYRLPRLEDSGGIIIVRLPFCPWGVLAPITFMAFCLLYIWKHRRGIDLIHGHLPDGAFAAAAANTLTAIPAVAHFHGELLVSTRGEKVLSRGLKGVMMKLLIKRRIQLSLAVSESVKQDLLQAGLSGKVRVLPNGVDVEEFSPVGPAEKRLLRSSLGLPVDAVLFVFSGRLELIKGLDILFKAWEAAQPETAVDCRLVVLGTGSLADEAYRFEARSGSILVRGITDNVRDYLRAADVFVMPSRSEGTSLALLESMSCSLAVIVTRVGGNPYLVEHLQNGIMLPPESVEELARWIAILAQDQKSRVELGEEARLTVCSRFSLERFMDDYQQLALELVTRGRS